MTLSEESRDRLKELAEGYEAAAFAEQLVMDGLAVYRDKFLDNDRDPFTMRCLRIYNDAQTNRRNYSKDAIAVREALEILNGIL